MGQQLQPFKKDGYSAWYDAFTVTNINEVFSGYQACQFIKNHQRFRGHLCPYHQGNDQQWSLKLLWFLMN
jgi:hypothetical protein